MTQIEEEIDLRVKEKPLQVLCDFIRKSDIRIMFIQEEIRTRMAQRAYPNKESMRTSKTYRNILILESKTQTEHLNNSILLSLIQNIILKLSKLKGSKRKKTVTYKNKLTKLSSDFLEETLQDKRE